MASSAGISLLRQIREIGRDAGAKSLAVAVHDYETGWAWSLHAERWFHAASTIKVPVLLAVFAAIREGRLEPFSRVHVRNRFLSVADGEPFRVGTSRDANSAVHRQLGRTMRVEELALHMIATSSNLATNLLLEVVGLEAAQQTLRELGLEGVELLRGVEDERAWERGINSRVTAFGLLGCFRLLHEQRAFAREHTDAMLEILHAQEFNSGIPAGLPDEARVAHKTGEISTVAHDGGLVFLPGRKPYGLVVLSEWDAERGGRQETIAHVSRAVWEQLQAGRDDG
ncbi:MAG: class A beta-lactamase-related serine hydrolase [Gemmatimonadota bacterium]|jgi:beta-lactamase class A|nr:class A beta-lactamase-related serine hydrolase [Gemmatimonadota bacterium]